MKKVIILLALISAFIHGQNLKFDSGFIRAHTEVFGDRTIDPTFHKATSKLTIQNGLAKTLKGTIEVSMKDFISDNEKRDEHMQSALESSSFPKASYKISEVVENGDGYMLNGTLLLHGVSKPLSFDATIANENGKVHIVAKSKIKMSDFGIEPPKMFLLTVRDQVDLSVDILLK